MRWDDYKEMKEKAIEETKIGGDPVKAVAFAILAHAEMVKATAPD